MIVLWGSYIYIYILHDFYQEMTCDNNCLSLRDEFCDNFCVTCFPRVFVYFRQSAAREVSRHKSHYHRDVVITIWRDSTKLQAPCLNHLLTHQLVANQHQGMVYNRAIRSRILRPETMLVDRRAAQLSSAVSWPIGDGVTKQFCTYRILLNWFVGFFIIIACNMTSLIMVKKFCHYVVFMMVSFTLFIS